MRGNAEYISTPKRPRSEPTTPAGSVTDSGCLLLQQRGLKLFSTATRTRNRGEGESWPQIYPNVGYRAAIFQLRSLTSAPRATRGHREDSSITESFCSRSLCVRVRARVIIFRSDKLIWIALPRPLRLFAILCRYRPCSTVMPVSLRFLASFLGLFYSSFFGPSNG